MFRVSKMNNNSLNNSNKAELNYENTSKIYNRVNENEEIGNKKMNVPLNREETASFYKKHAIQISEEMITPIIDFQDANLPQIIKNKLQCFDNPTPVQSVSIPISLQDKNMVAISETGSGKTLSYMLPALAKLYNLNYPVQLPMNEVAVLILAPTRELAEQINSTAQEYSKLLNYRTALITGGASYNYQAKCLTRGAHILTATPGRLIDLLKQDKISISKVQMVVLDEADRMLDMGFFPQLIEILAKTPSDSQMLLWSATWPKEIQKLAERFAPNYTHIKIGDEDGISMNKRIDQKFLHCKLNDKKRVLMKLIDELVQENDNNLPKTLIFANEKYKTVDIANELDKTFPSMYINGDQTHIERKNSMLCFKNNRCNVLVATDIASRGLDISDVKIVINYDLPSCVDSYVHRIGRTARSGKSGLSFSIISEKDKIFVSKLSKLFLANDMNIPKSLALKNTEIFK